MSVVIYGQIRLPLNELYNCIIMIRKKYRPLQFMCKTTHTNYTLNSNNIQSSPLYVLYIPFGQQTSTYTKSENCNGNKYY